MIAIIIPIPIYPILLLAAAAIGGIVKAVKRGQVMTARVDGLAFHPELSAIHRKVSPALRSATAISEAATSLSGVTVESQAPPTVFLALAAAGGLWVRIVADDRGDHTILTIEGRRKVNGLAKLSEADDTLFAFEKALRDCLVRAGHRVENTAQHAQPGVPVHAAVPTPTTAQQWAAPAVPSPPAPPNQAERSLPSTQDHQGQWW